MNDVLLLVLLIVAWVVLAKVVLPKFGFHG
jgi:hypothetical protein